MCSVTRDNFQQLYPQIKNSIKSAVFIAIDCEFSGLIYKDEYKNSLFDSNDERYIKLKRNMETFIPIQIGITTFHHNRDENEYIAHSYTFATIPRYFGTYDTRFTFQASSIQFLCDFNFDFNQLFYEGIPYISCQNEATFRQMFNNPSSVRQFLQETIRIDDEKLINEECAKITKWANAAEIDEEYVVEKLYQPEHLYILRQNLSKRTAGKTWSFLENGRLKIRSISPDIYEQLNKCSISHEEELLDAIVGFTKVYRLLTSSKKPIAGHNLLLDLMLMYSEFEGELPSNYTTFKKKIHQLFPCIYDTKHLSFELQHIVPKNVRWSSNALNLLYKYFKDERGRHIAMNSPLISLADGFVVKNDTFHEAGWDSFCTGYCFIRMAHIFASHHYETATPRILTSGEHMKIIQKYKNCVNVIRANVSHLKLDGPDPISQRPPWLYVSATKNKKVDIMQVIHLFGKYGSVDVKMLSKSTALVAVSTKRSAADILSVFAKHQDFQVTTYSALKHSRVAKACLWSGVLLSGSLLTWISYKLISSTSTCRLNDALCRK